MRKTSGHWIGNYLRERDINALFCVTGGHVFPVLDGCVEADIRVVDTRHEQAAAFAAEGWALRTGKPGVYTATAGPGFVNAVAGLAHASVTLSPTLCLGGEVPMREEDTGAPQEVEQTQVAAFYAKYAKKVGATDRIPQYMEKAFQEMLGSNPGPAYLGLPTNVSWRAVSEEVENTFQPRKVPRAAGDPEAVARAADLIKAAKAPVLVAGSGAFWAHAEQPLRTLAEQTTLPVFTRNAARGLLPDSHPQCYGGSPGLGVFKADVVVVVGSRLNSGFYYGKFGDGTSIIQVDCNSAAMADNQEIELGICGDAALVLGQLSEALDGYSCPSEWIAVLDEAAAKRQAKFEAAFHSDQQPIHPLRLLHELNEFADEKTTFAVDGGDIAVEAARHLVANRPSSQLSNGSTLGSLGPGVPFALGAKVAAPEDTVICVMGDGAFGFSAMEMDTAVRLDLPIIVVIGNDQMWGMIERGHREAFGENRIVAAHLGDRPYDKMVEAMGGYGERVEDPAEIRPALERAVASGKPACLNVMMASHGQLSSNSSER
jgi:acetolactate synthase-1/2/3 large subunit